MINITRSYPAPAALEEEKNKANGTYRHEEVLERIEKDFFGKCYICEYLKPTTINVEHLVAHRGDKDLMFSWDNLFWSCGHCNNTKLALYDDILDCTKEDVENCIKYKMDLFPKSEVKVSALTNSPRVEKTVELLNKVYNNSVSIKKPEAKNIRDALNKELREFQNLFYEYYEEDDWKEKDKESILRQIKKHLSSKSAFTAFKRWIVKDNPEIFKDFGGYIA